MKKSLIALAIASAVSAPAFAATSNVDVYGVLNLSVNWYNDQFDSSDIQVTSNASRIGFKGSEDLGGGLSAIWQIESGINADEGNGTFASRNTFVGLSGGWGTALLGKHDTPFKLVGRSVDLFGDTIADSRNLMGSNLGLGSSDMRANNVIAYVSPNFSGFNVVAAYSTDPVNSTSAPDGFSTNPAVVGNTDVLTINGTYTNGPLYLGAAYSTGDGLKNYLAQDDNWRFAAGYTLGDFRIVGQYDQYNASSGASNPLDIPDYSAWMVGGSYTMGAMVFKADYISGSFDNCDSADICDPDQWAIGMDYNLSKRTTVYGLYASGHTVLGLGAGDSDINASIDGYSLSTGDLGSVGGFALGIKHSF
jgi:predicted porin